MILLPVETYSGAAYPCVPITRVVTCDFDPSGPILASPKSDSLAVKSYQFSTLKSEEKMDSLNQYRARRRDVQTHRIKQDIGGFKVSVDDRWLLGTMQERQAFGCSDGDLQPCFPRK